MIVDVDIGNSRIKWRCQGGGVEAAALSAWPSLFDKLPEGVERVRVSNVAGSELGRLFSECCRTRLKVDAQFAAPRNDVQGLILAYPDPAQLGPDRWLAMLSARRLRPQKPILVISAGTALTADIITFEGRHLGGIIAPGLQTASKALSSNAQRLPIGASSMSPDWSPGADTYTCIASGFSAMYRGLLEQILERTKTLVPGASVLLTGGDGLLMLDLLNSEDSCTYHPALVLDGFEAMEAV